MTNDTSLSSTQRYCSTAAYLLMAVALFLIVYKGLLVALLSGMLTFSLIHRMAPRLEQHIRGHRAKMVAVGLLSAVVVCVLALAGFAVFHFFHSDAGSLSALLQKLADIIASARAQLPAEAASHLPQSADELQQTLVNALREHAGEAKIVGTHVGHTIMHLILGTLIGVMVAMVDTTKEVHAQQPLAKALCVRLAMLLDAFERIVFAQVKISAINTVVTALYLFVLLPAAGVSLPFKVTIVLVTFLAGLLPVVGNLISNSLLVVVSLAHSLHVAAASLVYMVVTHKLEYFLNARIIGQSISARAWEMLAAMLVMETLFGLPGMVAAPIFYAYGKAELMRLRLV